MRRLPCWLMVLVLVGTSGRGEEPPYKRLLEGEDARKADELEGRRAALEKTGKYKEALTASRELLQMRERLQGLHHWQTEDVRNGVATLEKILSLDEQQRRLWIDFQRLSEQASTLRIQGKYEGAERLYRKAVEISEQLLGLDHPVTARAWSNLAVNFIYQGKYADAETFLRRTIRVWEDKLGPRHPDTARGYSNLGNALAAAGKVNEAEQLLRRALEIWKETFGPRHPQTSVGYNSLGSFLNDQGKFAEAEALLRTALSIREEAFGPNDTSTMNSLNNLAIALKTQGKLGAAESLFRQSLLRREKTLGPHHPDTATACTNLAVCFDEEKRHAEAEALFRRVLEIRETSLGRRHPLTALSYSNLSQNLLYQGKLPEAELLGSRAVDLHEQTLGPAHPETALAYQNFGVLLDQKGKHGQAEKLYRKALEIHERALGQRHPLTLHDYHNLAFSLDGQGRHAEAEGLLRKLLELRKEVLGPGHPDTAATCHSLGVCLHAQGKTREAEDFFRQALTIWEQTFGASPPQAALTYHSLGLNLVAQKKIREAEQSFQRAVQAREAARLRLASTGFDRALGTPTDSHFDLALCLAHLEKPREAWQAAEAGMSRALLDNLASPEASLDAATQRHQQERAARLRQLDAQLVPLLSVEVLSAEKKDRRDQLVRQRAALLAEMDRDAVEQARGRVFPLEHVQQHIPADGALVFWADLGVAGEAPSRVAWHWACVLRRSGPPHWARLPGSAEDSSWTEADESLVARFRRALTRRSPECSKLARQLRQQRLDPLCPLLAATDSLPDVKRLLVIPVCALAGVPVEVLTDRYTVSYIPSATIFARLAEKHRAVEEPSLLALGDPAFKEPETPSSTVLPEHGLLVVQVMPNSPSARAGIRANDVLLDYDGISLQTLADFKLRQQGSPVPIHLWRKGKTLAREVPAGKLGLIVHKQPARIALKEQQELQTLLASSRGPTPRPLPGTRQEVEALARLLPSDRVQVLLGSRASEQQLTELATTGKIKEFRLLHFATHGAMDPVSPTRSALLLANDQLPDPTSQVRQGYKVYTGRLTVGTLLGWHLDADLVTLSACETGLGRQGGGEGYLGFVQALLQAGAHSVIVSLWPVDDAATALFMMRFYENLLGKRPGLKAPLGRAEALQEARRWLRGLTRSEAEALTAQLSQGQLRVTIRPLRPPAPPEAEKEEHPYAHPYYWSAFVLLGDPN